MGLYLAVGPALPGRNRDLSGPANLTETTSRCGARLASSSKHAHRLHHDARVRKVMESSLEAIEALVLATVPSDAPDRGEAAAGRRGGRNEARRSVARLAGTIPDRATRRVS